MPSVARAPFSCLLLRNLHFFCPYCRLPPLPRPPLPRPLLLILLLLIPLLLMPRVRSLRTRYTHAALTQRNPSVRSTTVSVADKANVASPVAAVDVHAKGAVPPPPTTAYSYEEEVQHQI